MAERTEHLAPSPVHEVVAGCVASMGIDLDAAELRGSGPKRLLRVVIDRDGGVPIDVITDVSRELSRALDRSAVMGEAAYTLEVTSRGLSRPLTLPRHWRRNVGRLAVATFADGRRERGRIAGADDEQVTLDDGAVWTYADVARAVIDTEMTKER